MTGTPNAASTAATRVFDAINTGDLSCLTECVTDDFVVIRALAHGVGATAFHGSTAEGKPYTMQTIHVYRTEGDRLAEHWGVRDELGALIQMGVVPAPTMPANVDA